MTSSPPPVEISILGLKGKVPVRRQVVGELGTSPSRTGLWPDAVPVRPAPTEALQQQPAVQQRALPPEGLEGGLPES